MRTRLLLGATVAVASLLGLAACASSDGEGADAPTTSTTSKATTTTATDGAGDETSTFKVEVWADNWMAVYVDGKLVGEDSVPITTERSFNAETFEFEAAYPFTLGIEAKDYQETESGLEYIGTDRQQMGDGGVIAQVTDVATGKVVATTNTSWGLFVVNRAPLNTECESSTDPNTTCEDETVDVPDGWSDAGIDLDDPAWAKAVAWSATDVAPKDGYDQITWDPAAELIWGDDLDVVNTILIRTVVTA